MFKVLDFLAVQYGSVNESFKIQAVLTDLSYNYLKIILTKIVVHELVLIVMFPKSLCSYTGFM